MKKPVPSFPRTLKVQDTGDFFKKQVRPQIRLEGQWLLAAGLKPNTHVRITNPQPGTLVIKFLD